MADGWFTMDASEFTRVTEAIERYGSGSGKIIDEVLHGEGAQEIKKRIAPLIPSSGRRWKGKATAARLAMPGAFKQDNGSLSVTVAARGKYGYLYFPDDGSNTVHHAGGQDFMYRGAQIASPEVINKCIEKLTESFNGGK